MDRKQLENIYRANGLTNYRLENTDDLLKCHGFDYEKVDGYLDLTDENKETFKIFIVKLFNAFGLDARLTIVPKGIYDVIDKEYVASDPKYDDCVIQVKRIITKFNNDGTISVLHSYTDDETKNLKIIETYTTKYLRFEYDFDGSQEWLHIIENGTEWY